MIEILEKNIYICQIYKQKEQGKVLKKRIKITQIE